MSSPSSRVPFAVVPEVAKVHELEIGQSNDRQFRSAMRRLGPAGIAALLGLVLTLVWTLTEASRPFYYDSINYWQLGSTFTHDGHFSLLNFHDNLRGYLFPLVTHLLRVVSGGLSLSRSAVVRIFNAGVVVAISTVLVPELAQLAWPQRRWGVARRLLLTLLMMVMWSGFLMFPLTDLPAIAAALLALIACAGGRASNAWWMIVAGFSAGAALDLRPAYVLLLPIVAILVLFEWWHAYRAGHANHRRRVACAVVATAAFALVSLPQALVMHRWYDSWSIIPGSQAGLTTLQYTEGIELQLYDTYVGQGEPPQMNYVDQGGAELLTRLPGERVSSLSQLLHVTLDHPLTMGTLFVRHIVNGLDQRYPSPYVARVDVANWWMRALGFALVLIALARMLWLPARRTLGKIRWRYPAALLICGATAIASSVETRFLLPVVLLSYAVVLTPGWRFFPEQAALSRRDAFSAGAVVALILALAVLIVLVTQATSRHLMFGFG